MVFLYFRNSRFQTQFLNLWFFKNTQNQNFINFVFWPYPILFFFQSESFILIQIISFWNQFSQFHFFIQTFKFSRCSRCRCQLVPRDDKLVCSRCRIKAPPEGQDMVYCRVSIFQNIFLKKKRFFDFFFKLKIFKKWKNYFFIEKHFFFPKFFKLKLIFWNLAFLTF